MEFELDDAFTGTLVTHAAGGAFNQIADTLVDAFVQEALRRPEAPPGPGAAG